MENKTGGQGGAEGWHGFGVDGMASESAMPRDEGLEGAERVVEAEGSEPGAGCEGGEGCLRGEAGDGNEHGEV